MLMCTQADALRPVPWSVMVYLNNVVPAGGQMGRGRGKGKGCVRSIHQQH